MALNDRIREEVRIALDSGTCEVAVGYAAGTVPLASRPAVKTV